MKLWKVTVVALHRARFAKSHANLEDCLISWLLTRTKAAAARWAALETIVVVSRYDRGGDFYWDEDRTIQETEEILEVRARRKRRRWKGWPAAFEYGKWHSRRTGEVLTEKEARRRNRISLTRRKRRKAREAAEEEAIPAAPKLDVFYREFSPYTTRDAFARVEEPPAYSEQEVDEDTIERLHDEYDELEAGGSPSGA